MSDIDDSREPLNRSLEVIADDPVREAAARDYFGGDYIPVGEAFDQPMVGPNVAFRGGWVAAMHTAARPAEPTAGPLARLLAKLRAANAP